MGWVRGMAGRGGCGTGVGVGVPGMSDVRVGVRRWAVMSGHRSAIAEYGARTRLALVACVRLCAHEALPFPCEHPRVAIHHCEQTAVHVTRESARNVLALLLLLLLLLVLLLPPEVYLVTVLLLPQIPQLAVLCLPEP